MTASLSHAPSSAPLERPPRLVLLFAIFTALGLALAGAMIVLVVRQADMVRSQREAISRARLAVESVLEHELRAADVAGPVPDARQRSLDELSVSRVLIEGTRDWSIYSADGRIAYSTQPRLVGQRLQTGHVREALTGTVVSEVGSSLGDTRKVLRTFVPVVLGPQRATGVVALEQDYAPIEAAARGSAWLIAGVLEALLVILGAIFIPVLARVSSRIRRHVGELDYVATHDELTDLPNRVGFRRAVEDALRSREPPGALLLFDLDGFSRINDALGYYSGDTLLSQVAGRLRIGLADCDMVARVGEDEFGVLLAEPSPEEIAGVRARVKSVLGDPFLIDGVRVVVDVHAGAALLGEHGDDFETVLRRAGVALSTAKTEGQDSLQIYDPASDDVDVARLALTAELREALDESQLRLDYQPLVDLGTRTVREVEALVRWQHPERGLLTAGEFIAEAERSGLAQELRGFVLETAARQWQEWRAHGVELEFAVNLGTVDMLDASLPDEIADLLRRYDVPAWNLILEITERTLVGDERRTGQVIERLSSIGVRLAIDDLGTGQSSLASLRRFPVHQIKLDRSLIADAPGDEPAEAIVSSCVEIAHAIGATVVAEGIETHDQWQFASQVGCDLAQGYLIGRPVPGGELLELLLDQPVVSRAA